VWIVSDATIKGSETGTSFRQALAFMDAGFNLHDTMIWCKDGGGAVGSNYCYTQNFEYMFVFSKGQPKATNLIYDKPNKSYNGTYTRRESRGGNDKGDRGFTTIKGLEYSRRNNWWLLVPQKQDGSNWHPAVFPEEIVRDHIISWSNEGDVVLDPFMGSGTTAKVARALGRKYIGFEISQEYVDLANKRLQETKTLFD
jgi:site-specific DNA-methyltransferase (adenine-specific)